MRVWDDHSVAVVAEAKAFTQPGLRKFLGCGEELRPLRAYARRAIQRSLKSLQKTRRASAIAGEPQGDG